MKRIAYLSVSILVLSVCSCNKSYICECLDPQKNALEHYNIKAAKDSDAESRCAEHNGTLTNCHIK